ncbi:MAG TPA: hypothetical protein VLS48_03605, partial [Anaerolineales bacterium]|nr:hypothetical protein [Anaerolineales bacterium]
IMPEDPISLDSVDFVSNDQLQDYLDELNATPEQEDQAIEINTEARLQALKISFLLLAGIALLAIFPALGLPGYNDEEILPVKRLKGKPIKGKPNS